MEKEFTEVYDWLSRSLTDFEDKKTDSQDFYEDLIDLHNFMSEHIN